MGKKNSADAAAGAPVAKAPRGRPRIRLRAPELSALLDALRLPVFATDGAGRIAYANAAACALVQRPLDLLLGSTDSVLSRALPPRGDGPAEVVLENSEGEHIALVLRAPLPLGATGLNVGHLLDVTSLRDTELACALHEKRLALLVDHLPLLIHAHDAEGNYVFWNRQCERVLGYSPAEAIGRPDIMERLYPDPEYRAFVRGQHRAEGGFQAHELFMRAADGMERVICWTHLNEAPPVPGWTRWEVGVDLTAEKEAQRARAQADARAEALFRHSPFGVHFYTLDQDGHTLRLTGANPAADQILCRTHSRLQGRPLEEVFPELTRTEAPDKLRLACTLGQPWRTERFDYQDEQIATAYELHCFQTMPGACACMFLDLTENKRLETRLRHQTQHDPLTGIANRALCLERIETALQRSKRRADYRHAVIYLDLDRFKVINDTLGHAVGDAVLVETARRLRSSVRELDTVARMGSDEFVVLMEEFDSYKRPIQAIKRIHLALQNPILAHGHEINVTASIGLALGQKPVASAVEALRNANLAMQRAKSSGRNRVKSFTDSMLTRAMNVVRLENEMDRAIARGEFFLEFQPIIQVGKEQRLFGFEALARWRHPERGLIMPGDFIPVAEDSGKVVELGYWALREGGRILAAWRARYPHLRDVMLSVNLSPQQAPRVDFLPRVREIIQETGLPARNLKLEVTETALMHSGPAVLNKLAELREMGVSFSVDDFGTGYSSLAYLTRLPLDHLKIDLSFVRMLESAQENREIVRAIIQLATSLRLDVVAEGVETLQQQGILRDLGCKYFQGYLFARPLPEDKAEEFLRRFGAGPLPLAGLSGGA